MGAARIARVEVSGAGIATTVVDAMTRVDPAPRLIREGRAGWEVYPLRPARFDLKVGPARAIVGIARDVETGEPLAGWRVVASFWGLETQEDGTAEGRTGSRGSYRIAGLPESPSYALQFTPPGGEPYLPARLTVSPAANPVAPLEPGAPILFDVAFRRRAIVRGRVVDRATGRPVAGWVTVAPYPGDPQPPDLPEFGNDGLTARRVGADGWYEVVAPPDRTVLAFEADPADRYTFGRGAELLPGFNPENPAARGVPLTATRRTSDYNALAPLEVGRERQAVGPDLEVEAEDSVELTILDPSGEPLEGVDVQSVGARSLGRVRHVEAARFDLLGFPPGHWRRVSAWHLGRKLAGSAIVAAGDGPGRAIRLAPWGEARGRLVGPAGAPRGDTALVAGPVFSREPRPEPFASLALIPVPDQLRTDPAGRLHLAGLIPGMHYGLSIRLTGNALDGDLFTDLVVGPGEVKDVGDVRVGPRR